MPRFEYCAKWVDDDSDDFIALSQHPADPHTWVIQRVDKYIECSRSEMEALKCMIDDLLALTDPEEPC